MLNFTIPPLFSFIKGELWPSFEGCPFPMYVTFSRSEYYGGSEPLGLSSRRVSHVYAHETFSTVRCPSVPYQAHCLLLVVKSFSHPDAYDADYNVATSCTLRRICGSSYGTQIRQSQSHHTYRTCSTFIYIPSMNHRFNGMLLSPLGFPCR
jgi:hypothetical protein